MKKIFCLWIFLALALIHAPARAQDFSFVEIAILKGLADRKCDDGEVRVWVTVTQRYSCGVGGSGAGTVTSIGLLGTANQITVTGTSPITSAGSFTLSIPTSPTLPGTTTGIFSGPLTGTASLATALATNPTDCAAGAYAKEIAASGNLGCDILNVIASVDPTANDDTGDGYIVGTKWTNDQGDTDPLNDTIWQAVAVDLGGATWVQIYPAASSAGNLAAVMSAGNTYFGADCTFAKAFIVGKDANNYWQDCFDESEGLRRIPVIGGVPDGADKTVWIRDGFTYYIKNRTTGAPIATVNADGTFAIEALKTTGAATGKTLVCADTDGVLFRSSSADTCAN